MTITKNDLVITSDEIITFALGKLVSVYQRWLEENNLPFWSADELVLKEDLSIDQRRWLHEYMKLWDDFT